MFKLTSETGTGIFKGKLIGSKRIADGDKANVFITNIKLPTGNKLHNSWMTVTYGNGFKRGYGIDKVEVKNGKTWIHTLDDHALRITGDTTNEVYYPQRTIKGTNTFKIYETTVYTRNK